MRKLTLAIDVDDVVAELVPAWQTRYNARFNDNHTPETWSTWDITKVVKPECGAAIYDILKEPDLYDDVQPTPDAQYNIEVLRSAGHRVLFVTSCGYDPVTVGASAGAKLAWLQRHGFLPARDAVKDYIIAAEKTHVSADLLLDDRADNIKKWLASGRFGLLYDRNHNRDYLDATRVRNWSEATYYIREHAYG